MSDSLTFNKYAGAVLATGFLIALLYNASGMVFSQEKVAKPGFKVDVVEDTGSGPAAPEVPPDWGTVLKTADVAAGQATFAKCQSCHNADSGGPNGTGPNLWGVVGRPPGSHPGFAYSDGMKAFAAKQPIWDYQHIYEFVKGPQAYIQGTKMTFVGLKQPQDRINVIAFLRDHGGTLPIPAPNPAAAAPAPATAPAAAPGAATGPNSVPAKATSTGTTATPASGAGGPTGNGPGAPKIDAKNAPPAK